MSDDLLVSFYLPGETLTLNKLPGTERGARAHRALKNLWFEAAYMATCEAFPGAGPKGRRMPACDVFVQLPVWGERVRDAGNWTLTTKPIIDAMVEAGVWPDDGPLYVTEKPVSFRVYKRKEDMMKARVYVRAVPR